jgi:hypothetical protein
MPGGIQFVSLGWIQEDPDDIIKIIVGQVEAPLTIPQTIVCEITLSNQVNLNPDFTFFKQDHHNQQFKVTLANQDYDLTTAQVTFTIKEALKDTEFLIQKKNSLAGGGPSEIEMIEPVEGRFVVYILPADTDFVNGDYTYWYDIEVTNAGETRTVKRGQVRILQDITN